MAPKTGPALRAKARAWWPELLWVAFAAAFCLTNPKQGLGAFALVVVFSAIFWIMGHRHRRLPMQATLDGVRKDVSEVREIITTAVAAVTEEEAEPQPPQLRVVR